MPKAASPCQSPRSNLVHTCGSYITVIACEMAAQEIFGILSCGQGQHIVHQYADPQNVRECPKEAERGSYHLTVRISHYACLAGRCLTGVCVYAILEAQLLACTLLPLYIHLLKGVAAGFSVPVITQSSLSLADVGLILTFFTLWGHSFVYTSELFLSSRDMWYIIERKVWSMGFSEVVYFHQGTHTNTD